MTARVLTLPRTRAGRDVIRRAMLASNGAWDFPDGSRADEIDWDELAVAIEWQIADFEQWSREREAANMSGSTRPNAAAELVKTAISRLLIDHGGAMGIGSYDLCWLGNLIAEVHEGQALRQDEVAQVSLIRAKLARRYHRYGGHAGMRRDRDGAA